MSNVYLRILPRWNAFLSLVLGGMITVPIYAGDATLSWGANTESNLAGYRLYYGLASRAYTTTINVGMQTSYSVTGLNPGTYFFSVTAYNTSGSESAFSNEVTKTISGTGDTTPPSAPTNLSAAVVSSSQINLSWNASSDNVAVAGYKLFRNGSQIPGSTTTTSYSDSALSPSTTYTYSVVAFDAGGNTSTLSSPASATTTSGTGPNPTGTVSINFQPSTTIVPNGYLIDDGSVFTSSRGYGWVSPVETRERGMNSDKRLDTFAFSQPEATWQYSISNGNYLVSLASGDPQWNQGPHRVEVEGTRVINDVPTTVNGYVSIVDFPISVADGQLTIKIGGTVGNTLLNYVVIKPSAPPVSGLLPAPTNVRVK